MSLGILRQLGIPGMATELELTLAHVEYFYSSLPPLPMEKGLDSGNNF